jgi:uncharacterized membrane-anchored protein
MSMPVSRKVPAVTFHFWAVKILSTAMGEAFSDYMVHTISPYEAVAIGFLGFVIAIVWQFALRRYLAPVYWLAVVMVAVFGTMVADVIHIVIGIPYAISAFDCGVARRSLRQLVSDREDSIHPQRQHEAEGSFLLGDRPRDVRDGHCAW